MLFPIRAWVERRPLVLAAAATMFVGIFAWRAAVSDGLDAVALLYVVPVALVALELGIAGGIAAATLALGLVGGWVLVSGAPLGAIGVGTRTVSFFTVGLITGRFSDRMRAAQIRHGRLLESGLVLAHLHSGEELPATLADQARRVSGARAVSVEVEGGVVQSGLERAGGWRESVPIEVRGVRYGVLTVSSPRPIRDEDLATLSMLASQAAVAAENHRLLEIERERALIQLQLEEARDRLARGQLQLRELIVRQEAERDHVAHELHEDAAQVLTAVQLGLAALERELGAAPAKPHLLSLRSEVNATLKSLRALAVRLRPQVLLLGLGAALEELVVGPRATGFDHAEIALGDLTGLDSDTETMAYRIVEEALQAVGAAERLALCVDAGGNLVIEIEGPKARIEERELTILRARLELSGGILRTGPRGLRAVFPLGIGGGSGEAGSPSAEVGGTPGEAGDPPSVAGEARGDRAEPAPL